MKKSRQSSLFSILVIALVVALAFSVVACNPKTHEHKWDAGTVTTEATYLHEGVMTYKCEEDDETKTEPIAALGIPAAFRGTWYSPDKENKLVIAEKSIEFYQGESTKLNITDADGKNNQLTFKYEGTTYNVTTGDNKLVVNGVDYVKDGGTVTPPTPSERDTTAEKFRGYWVSTNDSFSGYTIEIDDKNVIWTLGDWVEDSLDNFKFYEDKITFTGTGGANSYEIRFNAQGVFELYNETDTSIITFEKGTKPEPTRDTTAEKFRGYWVSTNDSFSGYTIEIDDKNVIWTLGDWVEDSLDNFKFYEDKITFTGTGGANSYEIRFNAQGVFELYNETDTSIITFEKGTKPEPTRDTTAEKFRGYWVSTDDNFDYVFVITDKTVTWTLGDWVEDSLDNFKFYENKITFTGTGGANSYEIRFNEQGVFELYNGTDTSIIPFEEGAYTEAKGAALNVHMSFWNTWEGFYSDHIYTVKITDNEIKFYIDYVGKDVASALVTYNDLQSSEVTFTVDEQTYVIYLQRSVMKLCQGTIDEAIAELYGEGTEKRPYELDRLEGTHDITLKYQDDYFINNTFVRFTQEENKVYSVSYDKEFQNILFVLYEEGKSAFPVASWSNFNSADQTKGASDFQLLAGKTYILRLDGVEVGKNNKFTLTATAKDLAIDAEYIGEWQTLDYDDATGEGARLTIDATGITIDSELFGDPVKAELKDIFLARGGTGYQFTLSVGFATLEVTVSLTTDDASSPVVPAIILEYIVDGEDSVEWDFYKPDNMPKYREGSVKNPKVLTEAEFVKSYSEHVTEEYYYSFTPAATSTYTITKGTCEYVYIEIRLDGEVIFTFDSSINDTFVIKLEEGNTYIVVLSDSAYDGGSTLDFTITKGGEYVEEQKVEIPADIRNITWQPDGSRTVTVNQYDFTVYNVVNVVWKATKVETIEGKTVVSAQNGKTTATFTYDPSAHTLTFDNGGGTTITWLAEGAEAEQPLASIPDKFHGKWANAEGTYTIEISANAITGFTDDEWEGTVTEYKAYENRITFTASVSMLGNEIDYSYVLVYNENGLQLYYASSMDEPCAVLVSQGAPAPALSIPEKFRGTWKNTGDDDYTLIIDETSVTYLLGSDPDTTLADFKYENDKITFTGLGGYYKYEIRFNDQGLLELYEATYESTYTFKKEPETPAATIPDKFVGNWKGEVPTGDNGYTQCDINITANAITITEAGDSWTISEIKVEGEKITFKSAGYVYELRIENGKLVLYDDEGEIVSTCVKA